MDKKLFCDQWPGGVRMVLTRGQILSDASVKPVLHNKRWVNIKAGPGTSRLKRLHNIFSVSFLLFDPCFYWVEPSLDITDNLLSCSDCLIFDLTKNVKLKSVSKHDSYTTWLSGTVLSAQAIYFHILASNWNNFIQFVWFWLHDNWLNFTTYGFKSCCFCD